MADFDINRRTALQLAALATLVPGPAEARAAPSMAALDAFLRRSVVEDDLAGIVALSHHGRTVFAHAYGLANRDHDVPNRIDTCFNLASMNKMFTAVAILRLVDAGRIDLDSPLARYVPDWPNAAAAQRITLTQLLSHSSGIGNFWEALDKHPKERIVTLRDHLPLFAGDPLEFEPGTRFGYSNGGYIALGMVIETVTGTDYHSHVRETIFRPLAMTDTDSYRIDRSVPRRATGYARSDEAPGGWSTDYFASTVRGSSAGGGYSTAGDMLRFAAAYRAGRLMTDASRARATKGLFGYPKGEYGLGFSVDTVSGHRIVGHSGGHIGIANELMIFEDSGWTAIILTNGDVDAYWRIAARIKDMIVGPSAGTAALWHTERLIEIAAARGAVAAISAHDALANAPKPRSSVIEVAAAKYRHRRNDAAAAALDSLAVRYAPA